MLQLTAVWGALRANTKRSKKGRDANTHSAVNTVTQVPTWGLGWACSIKATTTKQNKQASHDSQTRQTDRHAHTYRYPGTHRHRHRHRHRHTHTQTKPSSPSHSARFFEFRLRLWDTVRFTSGQSNKHPKLTHRSSRREGNRSTGQ